MSTTGFRRNPRLEQLIMLEEKIRVALLGESETRWDLLELQKKVKEEIKQIVESGMAFNGSE